VAAADRIYGRRRALLHAWRLARRRAGGRRRGRVAAHLVTAG